MKMTVPRSTFRLAILFALVITSMEQARGQKPSPPPPFAPGKILFTYPQAVGTIWEMNGNGTSPTNSGLNFAPVNFPVPSSRTYSNGRRWWLIQIGSGTESTYADLAVANGESVVQLTESGVKDNMDGTESYIRFAPSSDKPSWSNDGQDSFCSVLASRYRKHIATGEITNLQQCIYRLPVSGAELDSIAAAPGSFTPFFQGDPRITSIIMTNAPGGSDALTEHHWSPNGNKITFINRNSTNPMATDLFVADVSVAIAGGGEVNVDKYPPIVSHQLNTYGVKGPRWCPVGGDNRILYSSNGQICTILPGNPVVNLASSGMWYSYWSPDGAYVAYDKRTVKGNGYSYLYNVWRVPASGGTSVNLTSTLDPAVRKQLKGWVNSPPSP